jgi:PAS domain S-box-containing protein
VKIFSQSSAIHDFDHQLRLRAMFESAAIGIGICHLNGRIADANPELSRLLGYSNDELANSTFFNYSMRLAWKLITKSTKPATKIHAK